MTTKHAKSMLHQILFFYMKSISELNSCHGLCMHNQYHTHSTVNEVPEISVQDCAQAVAMATKHAKLQIVCRRNTYLAANSSIFQSM